MIVKERDGGAAIPMTGRCNTSRNVVFDEASSWWPPQQAVLPNSKEIEDKVQEKMGAKEK